MKIRFTRIRNLASSKAKGATYGILLFLLAFAVPRIDNAQDKPTISGSSQQSGPASAPSTAGKPLVGAILDVKIAPEDSKATVTVTTNRLLAPQEFMLDDPRRLVLDFPDTENRVKSSRMPVHAASVTQVRVQQFQSVPSPIARMVFDLEEDYGAHEITVNKTTISLVFHKGPSKSSPASTEFKAKPALNQAESPTKPTSPAAQTGHALLLEPIKASANLKASQEAAVKGPAVSKPLTAARRSDSEKAAVPGTAPKTSPANSAAKSTAALTPSAAAQAPAARPETPKAAAVKANPKPRSPEPAVKKSEPAAPSAAAQPAAIPRSESPKATVAKADPKPRLAAPKAPAVAPTPVPRPEPPKAAVANADPKPRPAAPPVPVVAPTLVPRPEPPKAAAANPDPKQHPPEPAAKKPESQVPLTAAQPSAIPRSESPKAPVANTDQKPRLPEPAPKAPAAEAPLMASLAPVSIAAPTPKMAPPSNSPFTGQPLTLDLIDMPLVDFFRLMAEEGGINIVMDPEVKGRTSIKVVKLPWDQIFDAVLANHSLDKQVQGSLVRVAKKSTLQEEARQREALKKATLLAADLETRIKRLNYTKAESLAKSLLDQKTVRGTVVVDERTNSLILTDIPSSLNKLSELIETLDIPQAQVEIEARIVSATRDFARDIGIQFGFVDGNLQRVTVGGPNTFGTIGGTRPSATPTSTFAAGNGITGRGASDNDVSGSASISTGTSTTNKGNFNVNLPSGRAFGGIGISVGNIFDTFLLDAAITAGESKGFAKLISQPKVTAQNNSSATITQGLRFPVQVIANNTISVQFQNAALTLVVTPQITYEGNIVLDLKVENNTPDFSRQVNNIPSIRTSESTTRVLVSDGGTTVIGGILIDNESTAEDKVPGLGSLPVLGNLFRRSSVSRGTQEVLFFVTPRIIK